LAVGPTLPYKSDLDRFAGQFPQRIGGDPARASRVDLANFPGGSDCGPVQARVALADLPQRPVNGFLHEVALVDGLALDAGQEFPEPRVWRLLVVNSEHRHQGKSRPLDEFFLVFAPFVRFAVREGRFCEQVQAAAVADSPGIDRPRPALHLRFGDAGRFIDHGARIWAS
jgi:hypothetical protein